MAVKKVTMPQLGESVTEGTISKWLVQEGDQVNKYDPIAEVMTDKVNAEIPSSYSGIIHELTAAEGDTLAVGEVICFMDVAGEADDQKAEALEQEKAGQQPSNEADKSERSERRARYSPAVLKLSQEHGIDLTKVTGSGKGGRITRKDLLTIIRSNEIPKAGGQAEQQSFERRPASMAETSASASKTPAASVLPGDVSVPVSGVRKTIAANMVRSKQEIPHAWTMMEVDVTNLVSYRDSIKEEFKKREGFNLTYFAFFIKAVAQALKEFPQMNSMWAGEEIIQKKDINLSIAVATDEALYVPVIKRADEKTIKGIGREVFELANKVRAGTLKAEDMQGGTFTVNNTGSFGSVQSMGIINYPQAAILQIESIVKRPVVMPGGMIAVRDMVNICLSLDHRVLDGLVCGRFLKRVKEILENISEHTSIY
ncbi:dihydrolipoamide acetyltransferase family protein [Bacillus xiapuensis]|uniref:dihydrolipoamide acetyltransferase family protein n=1 Tax=Bacillus xiapuensis TaxID=2014075 RepID=UPI000C2485EE|nr:dihydrolipoamide acetyltransferase family protein [Bacillus xiapuensis]